MENSSANSIQYNDLPIAYAPADAVRHLERWEELTGDNLAKPLLLSVFGNSPYLSRLALLYPGIVHDFMAQGADTTHAAIMAELAEHATAVQDYTELMRVLRTGKGKMALLVALADITGMWVLPRITGALSLLAETCLTLAINAILIRAHRNGEIVLPHPDTPSKESGLIVLGMGKLGGCELNYSSDIDLILFYEPGQLQYKGRHNEQHFMNRVAHDLVTLMQERTPDGYVFRTDLRLRPDPASTPPVMTIGAAHNYYESVGQNWERAAMIKARPVAGDITAGERFLKGIGPFMWRRSLDFASINDIHSIKRQMDSIHSKTIQIKGHNVKLGMGGIREIEFYAQIHQLIWGGRESVLRTRATCETLGTLAKFGLVEPETKDTLCNAYAYLRKLEHRLQMVQDEQTHSMPETDEGVAHIACFMGYNDVASFEKDLLHTLNTVHAIYASSFKNTNGQEAGNLGGSGKLVFTGTLHDPETLDTLRGMGFTHPETISEIVMGWHHGSKRATRTKRARELLTELMPQLLGSLANTVHPDTAFLKFNEFLTNLPAGVQLFSLFNINPHLLQLIADIMGSAPTLADTLSKFPALLDAVLYEDFYHELPSSAALAQQLDAVLADAPFEEAMNRLRHFRSEKHFQAGVQLLRNMITSHEAGIFLACLADVIIRKTLACVTTEFIRTYGVIQGSRFAIIGLGKLGSREMTFSSDIDLVFVYDVPDFEIQSDGEKSFGASVYYNRLAQRFLNALTAMGNDGRLYEVDTRLRPSGTQGLLAVSTKALSHYFSELAWTFEYMAFSKARIISADGSLGTQLEQFIVTQLARPRDTNILRQDVGEMRERIAKEHHDRNTWDIKYVRGGLMDIDFIAQYLLLAYAPEIPGAAPGSASEHFKWLEKHGRISPELAHELIEADRFLSQVFHMLRLCTDRAFDEATAPEGLKKLLIESLKEHDFNSLKEHLIQVEQSVHGLYIALLQPES